MVAPSLVAVVAPFLDSIGGAADEFRVAVLVHAALGALVFFGALTLGRLGNPIAQVSGAESAVLFTVTPLEVAFALALLSLLVYGVFVAAGRSGFGPLARPLAPDDPLQILEPPSPPPSGWLRPGRWLGLPIVWAAACLIVLPVAVYVVAYVPWAALDGHQLVEGYPAGHEGQTLLELTGQMYRYHNELADAHAASSPWWAWPFDLKPVWFYQGGFGDGTAAAIYDAGNLVIWWLGVPAMAFVAYQAYRRRSLALALIAVGFAAQWIPWARIDRAAFQYHYYTALPFIVLALAYFVAELWHGASRRTWMLAKGAAALAIVAPALMHLLSRPLCGFVDVLAVNDPSAACPPVIPQFVLTWRTAALALVVGTGVLLFLLALGGRFGLPRWARDRSTGWWTIVGLVVLIAAAIPILVVMTMTEAPLLTLERIPVEPIALLVAIPLGYLAVQVLGTRDPRRFVGGVLVAVVVTFLVFYPNFSALPLPSTMVNAYQGLLPTYLYDFQFPVSEVNRSSATNFATPVMLALIGVLVFTCIVVAYSAWTWRITLVERRLLEGEPPDEGAQAAAGSPG